MTTQSVIVVFDYFPNLAKALPAKVAAALKVGALGVETNIKANIVDKHIIDTGAYLGSWITQEESPMSVTVSSDKDYGIFQEFGTRFMAARPHIAPAVARQAPLIVAAIRKAVAG